ncbi:MAG: hypothetical protein WBO34_07250 [Gammaproteobacteria bacterium]
MKKRNTGERRWGLDTGFPVKDSHGILVITERRNSPDRRLENTSLEERQLMFASMPTPEIE